MVTFAQLPQWILFAAEEGNQGGSIFGMLAGPMFPLIVIFVLFYFMLIRPERRRRAEQNLMLQSVKKNDKVITIGGIKGTIVNVQTGSDEITVKVDEDSNTKLRMLRSAIARVLTDEDGGSKN